MTEAHPRRGPLSTISGWMITIAVIGATMGVMVFSPFLFILVIFILSEALAVTVFRGSRRRKRMSGYVETLWVFAFLIVIPIVSVVAALTALSIYCTVNPNAYQ